MLEYTGQAVSTAPKYQALTDLVPAYSKVGCIDGATSSIGIGDGVYVGMPAVTSPGRGAAWIQGRTAIIAWDVTGRAPSTPYTLRLWQTSNCVANGGQLIATVATGVFVNGTASFTVSPALPAGNDYYVEIADSCVQRRPSCPLCFKLLLSAGPCDFCMCVCAVCCVL